MRDRIQIKMAAQPFPLPKDLMIEILTKLPAKSLIRLTAVNKTWLSLIRSSGFVSLYRSKGGTEQFLCRSSKDGSRFALITDRPDGDGDLTVELGSIINPDNRFPIRFWDSFHPFVHDCFEIVGSFEGLICLCFSRWGIGKRSFDDDRPWTIFLWNPSIRRHLVLPLPHVLPQKRGVLGFCGSGDGDHKVVRILCTQLYLNEGKKIVMEVRPSLRSCGGDRVVTVEIYSLNSGEWRILQLQHHDLYPKRSFVSGQAFVQGKMHWISFKDDSPDTSTRVITSFNVDEETFRDISFPTSNVDFGQLWISVVGDTVGFLDVHFPSSCYLWVMQEYGNANSWSMLYNMEFATYAATLQPLVDAFKLWKDVEVFTATNHGLANFKSLGRVTAVGEHGGDSFVFIAKHVESLVLLEKPNAVSDMHLVCAPTVLENDVV